MRDESTTESGAVATEPAEGDEVEGTHHYLLTVQWTNGIVLITRTRMGTLTPIGSRKQIYLKLMDEMRQDYGLPAEMQVITLYFSLEPNDLSLDGRGLRLSGDGA